MAKLFTTTGPHPTGCGLDQKASKVGSDTGKKVSQVCFILMKETKLEILSSSPTNYIDMSWFFSDLTANPRSPVNMDCTQMVSRRGDMSHTYKAQALWSTIYFCPQGRS